jgi:hypothetical protein
MVLRPTPMTSAIWRLLAFGCSLSSLLVGVRSGISLLLARNGDFSHWQGCHFD